MWRIWDLLKGLGKLLLICAIPLALLAGWRAYLHWGPALLARGSAAPPAMFAVQARALLRPLESLDPPEVLVPTPQALSSQDMQLKLMKWRDSKNWMPAALALGEPRKNGLLLHSGRLSLEEIQSIGPIQSVNGEVRCQARLRVRWTFPEALQEIHRVRDLVNLRLPKGLAPGQDTLVTCTFVQDGWSWRVAALDPPLPIQAKTVPRIEGLARWMY